MLFSCSSEESLVQSTQNRSVIDAKNWFEITNNNKNFEILQYTKELLWDNAIVSNGDKGEVIEVPLILQENISTSTNLKIKDYHRLLFMKRENSTYDTKYIQVFTADSTYNNLDKEFNYYSIKDNFNGSLYVLNGMAKSGTSLKFKKGEKINPHFTAKDSDQAEIICMYVGWWYEDGSFDPIIELACFGGGGGGEYLGNTTGGNTTGGYGGSGNGSSTTNTEVVDDTQIINELTGKEKCLNALLDKNGDSFVKNLLANFEGESEFDIIIVSKDKVFSEETKEEVNGRTMYDEPNPLITIEISTTRINEHSALDAARTILHEYIHADMYRKLYTKDITNIDVLDFKKTYEAYGNQHGTMGALYINSMKEALKEFHKNALTADYNKYTNYYGEAPTDAFYEALAWGGLRDHNVKSWTDLPPEKRAAIESLANRAILLTKTVTCPN